MSDSSFHRWITKLKPPETSGGFVSNIHVSQKARSLALVTSCTGTRSDISHGPFDRDGEAGVLFIGEFESERFFERLLDHIVLQNYLSFDGFAGSDRFRQIDIEVGLGESHQSDLEVFIGNVSDFQFLLSYLFPGELGHVQLVRGVDHWIGRIRSLDHGCGNSYHLVRATLVGLNLGRLGYFVSVFFGAEDNFQPGAVTDSNGRFVQRRFGAASAWFYFQNLEGVVSSRVHPEYVGDLRVLWRVAEIKGGFFNQ